MCAAAFMRAGLLDLQLATNLSTMPQRNELTLLVSTLPRRKLLSIRCTKCGHDGNPTLWKTRIALAAAFIATAWSLLAVVVYVAFTNPYICTQCKQRHHLVKILNDRSELPIKSSSKGLFLALSLVLIVAGLHS